MLVKYRANRVPQALNVPLVAVIGSADDGATSMAGQFPWLQFSLDGGAWGRGAADLAIAAEGGNYWRVGARGMLR